MTIQYQLELINADALVLKIKHKRDAKLIQNIEDVIKNINEFIKKDPSSEVMKESALVMLHQYFEYLKRQDIQNADKTLQEFLNAHPAPHVGLRNVLYSAASLILTLAIILFPIPLMIFVNPLCGLLFFISIPTALSLEDKINDHYKRGVLEDTLNHHCAFDVTNQAQRISIFFKASKVDLDVEEHENMRRTVSLPLY